MTLDSNSDGGDGDSNEDNDDDDDDEDDVRTEFDKSAPKLMTVTVSYWISMLLCLSHHSCRNAVATPSIAVCNKPTRRVLIRFNGRQFRIVL